MVIRQLSTSLTGNRIAAGEFEKRIHIWDASKNSCICSFDCILDVGGRRLAISADGKSCVAAAYHNQGIANYSADNGKVLWHRKDLEKSQFIRFSADDRYILVGLQNSTFYFLERHTGETVTTLRGIKSIYSSIYKQVSLYSKINKKLEIKTGNKETNAIISLTTFAELDVAFSPKLVCVSESAGPLRCFNLLNSEEIWRYHETGSHFLKLAYDSIGKSFLAVSWEFEKGGDLHLMRFNADSGKYDILNELEKASEVAFFENGAKLINRNGTIYETKNGTICQKLWS